MRHDAGAASGADYNDVGFNLDSPRLGVGGEGGGGEVEEFVRVGLGGCPGGGRGGEAGQRRVVGGSAHVDEFAERGEGLEKRA